MLSTILTESCFTQAHTPVTLLLVAQGPIVQLGNTTQILIRAAALTPEPAIGRQLVHLTSQFAQSVLRTRIAHRICAKAINALHVIPDARHATVQALMTVNRVTHPARIRIM